jgi:hypothetical protein
MPRSPSDPELKAAFSVRIKELLADHTAQDIAITLRVKRQTIYNYRDGKNAPSPEVIRRAMEAWPGFALNYRGKIFTLQDFQRKPVFAAKKAVQYDLWDAINKLDSESVQIEILKKDASSVQLGVQIYFRSRQ